RRSGSPGRRPRGDHGDHPVRSRREHPRPTAPDRRARRCATASASGRRPRRPQRHLRRLRQLRRLARRIATDVRSLRVRPRRPMNVAVDRDAIVDQVLAGEGQPATTPITDAYPEHVPIEFGPDDPAARTARAGELLSDAGWEPGPDGIRTKNGARAELSVAYHADDSVRRELAAAFADQMRPLGIAVEPRGTSWDEIEANADSAAILLAGGDNPYTIDTQARRALHSRTPASGPFDNPGGYRNPALDAALDRLREPGNRTPADALYQDVQPAYGADPGPVLFATLRHTYAVRDTGHTGPAPILEPHTHGVTWGPWWALSQWTPRP